MSCDGIETRDCQFVDEVVNYHRLDRLAAYLPPGRGRARAECGA